MKKYIFEIWESSDESTCTLSQNIARLQADGTIGEDAKLIESFTARCACEAFAYDNWRKGSRNYTPLPGGCSLEGCKHRGSSHA